MQNAEFLCCINYDYKIKLNENNLNDSNKRFP